MEAVESTIIQSIGNANMIRIKKESLFNVKNPEMYHSLPSYKKETDEWMLLPITLPEDDKFRYFSMMIIGNLC